MFKSTHIGKSVKEMSSCDVSSKNNFYFLLISVG